MIIEGKVGAVSKLASGATTPLRTGSEAELIIGSAGKGMYAEAVLQGRVYTACTQSGIAVPSALSTTATGLILTNPVNSGRKLVVLGFQGAITAAPGGAAPMGLAVQLYHSTAVTHTTALTVRNCLFSGSPQTGVGLVDSAATLAQTPVFIRALPGSPIAASAITTAFMQDRIDGQIVLDQGTALATFSLTTAVSGIWSIVWYEVEV